MDVSRIFLFDDADEAQNKYAYYSQISGFNVLLIGPTDVFRIKGQSPNTIEWRSGQAFDWHMLIVTEAEVWTSGDGVVPGPA